MRKPVLIICLIMVGYCMSAFGQPTPFLDDLLKHYPSIRDIAIHENEAYFTAQSPLGEISVIMVSKKIRNRWRKPQIASFSGKYGDLEPFLSADGNQLYFASNRPLDPEQIETKDYDLWVVTRGDIKAKWSEPVNLGEPVNTEHNEFYPSLTNTGKLYYTSDRPDAKGKDDIFYCDHENGAFKKPVSLSDSINTTGYEFNAFIARDESYLIFSGYNRSDGLGSGDLYISFRQDDNSWTRAMNLGENINSKYMDYCPFVGPDGETLYFTSRRSDIIQKESHFKNTELLLKTLNQASNGQSRLYRMQLDLLKD